MNYTVKEMLNELIEEELTNFPVTIDGETYVNSKDTFEAAVLDREISRYNFVQKDADSTYPSHLYIITTNNGINEAN